MYTDQFLSNRNTPEHNFWATYLTFKINDALGSFKIPTPLKDGGWGYVPTLEAQYTAKRIELSSSNKKISSRYQLQRVNYGRTNECAKARLFIESSDLDEICEALGYGSTMVNKIFELVQKGITLEKKLYDEFKKPEREKVNG